MKLMCAVLTTWLQVPVAAAEPLWKQMATFGIVGAICAWLLIERWIVSGKEREARQALASSIQANTTATSQLASKIEDMNRAMWNFVMFGSAKMKVSHDATPPHSPKVPQQPGS